MSSHNPVGHLVAEHPGVIKAGRIGWFAKGVVYLLAGVLALSVAINTSRDVSTGHEASPVGAIKTIGQSSGGTLLLLLLAAGLLLYASWRLITAALPGDVNGKAIAHRVGYVASAVMYVAFAITAIALAIDSRNMPDGNEDVSDISNWFMRRAVGRVLIGLVGLVIIVVGLYRVFKGVKLDVEDELDMSGTAASPTRWADRLGAVGEIGRGIGFGLVGFFLVRSSIEYDPNEATGLDGALRRLADEPWGLVVVIVVGFGFAAYGIFCLLTFSHRRLEAP